VALEIWANLTTDQRTGACHGVFPDSIVKRTAAENFLCEIELADALIRLAEKNMV
jgi:hypothetical protein